MCQRDPIKVIFNVSRFPNSPARRIRRAWLTCALTNVTRFRMARTHRIVYLKETASGETLEAELWDEIGERHLADVEEIWQPALTVLTRWSGREHRQESSHWNWRAKMRRVRRSPIASSFAIVYRDVTQGVMIVDASRTARLEPDCGQGLVYVEYVEVAPWNRAGWKPDRMLQWIGTVLVRAAVNRSIELGFGGRIGLHSLPQADTFYRHIGMTNLGVDAKYQNLCYFEMTSQQAIAFREVQP